MRLYHVSPSKNDTGIRKYGLVRNCSRCRERLIWLVKRDMVEWSIEHVRDRHHCYDVTVWIVRVPPDWVRQRGHGPYVCLHDVPCCRIDGQLAVTAAGDVHLSEGKE